MSNNLIKVLKPIFAAFRENGIKGCYNICDSLTMKQDFKCCLNETGTVISELCNLGFTINNYNWHCTIKDLFHWGKIKKISECFKEIRSVTYCKIKKSFIIDI